MPNDEFNSIRRLRYPLPEVIEPTESVCIEVRVPNDIGYISAFWGQMFALTRWYAWAGDTDHTAKQVAKVWADVYAQAQESECEHVLLRTSPFNSCELQVSYDEGETWITKFDARPCAITAINDVLGSGSDQPGGHTQPGEQPGGADPEPFQCFDFDVSIPGNTSWLIPLNLASGWSLSITQLSGAWNDGDFVNGWQCPNGFQFSLGACGTFGGTTFGTDPMPSELHMRLILRLADGTYAALPLNGDAYEIPAGQPAGNYFLHANDTPINDNQGSIAFHLLACNASSIGVSYIWGSGPSSVISGHEIEITPSFSSGFGGFYIIDVGFSQSVNVQWVEEDVEARSQDAVLVAWGADYNSPKYQAGVDNGLPFTDFTGLAALNTHKGEEHTGTRWAVITGGNGPFRLKVTLP